MIEFMDGSASEWLIETQCQDSNRQIGRQTTFPAQMNYWPMKTFEHLRIAHQSGSLANIQVNLQRRWVMGVNPTRYLSPREFTMWNVNPLANEP